jgi:hypothetical protein
MGEQFGLLTRIAATESVTLCVRDEKLTAFIELEAAIRCRFLHLSIGVREQLLSRSPSQIMNNSFNL